MSPRTLIDTGAVDDIAREIAEVARVLARVRLEIAATPMDEQVAGVRDIRGRMQRTCDALANASTDVGRLAKVVATASDRYRAADARAQARADGLPARVGSADGRTQSKSNPTSVRPNRT